MATREEILRFVVQTEGGDGLRTVTKDIDALAVAAKNGEPEAQALLDELSRLSEATNAVNALGRLKVQLADTGVKLGEAKRKFDDLNASFGVAGPKTQAQTKALAKLGNEVEKLAKEEGKLQVAVLKASGTIEKHGGDVNNLGRFQQALADKAKAAATAVKAFGTAANDAAKGAASAGKNAAAAASGFQKFRTDANAAAQSALKFTSLAGAISTALGTVGGGALFAGAIDSATTFQQKLTTIGAVTGANTEEMARFKQAAEDATKTTNFSASESADALLELAKASGDAAAATAQLTPTLNLAQAAGIDTAEAARIMTTTLTQFGLAATDAAHVADLFVTEANTTEDSVSKLGNAMSYVAPLARQLGLSLEDTTAILGALAKESFQGERAGTALRNVFSQLSDPASKFREALRGIGITSTDFIEVIKQLVAAGDRGKVALLALDAEARPAIQALVNSGGKNLDVLTEALQRNGGEAERQSQKMGESFDGASKRLMNAFDQLRRDLVEPILTPVADQFDDVATRVRAFIETADFAKIIEAIKTFAVQATAALIQLGKDVDYSALAEQIKAFAGDATAFFKSLKENTQATLSTVTAVVHGISTVFNSLQAVVLSAGAVISAALLQIANAALQTVTALSKLPGAGDALAGTVADLQQAVGGLAAVTEDFATRAATNFRETGEAAERFGDAIADAATAAQEAAPEVEKVGDASRKAAGGVKEMGNELGLLPDYAGGGANAVEQVVGPVQDLGRDALLTAQHVTKFSDAAQKLGGGPLAAAAAAVRAADQALSDLVLSGNASQGAIDKAATAARKARADLDALRTGASGAAVGVDELDAAYKRLGVTSQADLVQAANQARTDFEAIRATAGTTAEGVSKTAEAFVAYAQKVIASVASADSATKAQAQSMLRSLAAQVQATNQLEALLGKQKEVGAAAQDTGQKQQQAGEQGAKALDKTKEAAEGAKEATEEAGQAAESATVSYEGIGRASAKAIADLHALTLLRLASTQSLNIAIQVAKERLQEQEAAAAGVQQAYENLDDAGALAMANTAGGAENAAERLRQMAAEARAGRSTFDELDQSSLDNLAAAAESAAAKIEEITRKAQEAKDALRGMADSAQDEIDRLKGNEVAIEQRQFEESLRQIQERAEAAGDAGRAEAERARASAEELHQLRLEQIRKEEAERNKQSQSGGDRDPTPRPDPPPRPGGGGGSGGGGGVVFNVNVTVEGTVTSEQNLARSLSKILRDLWNRGG